MTESSRDSKRQKISQDKEDNRNRNSQKEEWKTFLKRSELIIEEKSVALTLIKGNERYVSNQTEIIMNLNWKESILLISLKPQLCFPTKLCYGITCSYTAQRCSTCEETLCKAHLINTLIKESQAGVLITDKGALLYETAEHLSLGHEGVEPLVRAVSALYKAYMM